MSRSVEIESDREIASYGPLPTIKVPRLAPSMARNLKRQGHTWRAGRLTC